MEDFSDFFHKLGDREFIMFKDVSELLDILESEGTSYNVAWFDDNLNAPVLTDTLRLREEWRPFRVLQENWGSMRTTFDDKEVPYGDDYSDHEKFCDWLRLTYSEFPADLLMVEQTEREIAKGGPDKFVLVENDEGLTCVICITDIDGLLK